MATAPAHEEVMREYETTFIIQPEISDEGVQVLCERLDGILGKNESVRLFYDDQGRRRLAYEIENFQKGRYITLMYLDSGSVVSELERSLKLDDSVLRFLTVQVTEEVQDIEARKAAAAELERLRAQKAAERAAREAEDVARAAEEEVRLAAEAASASVKGDPAEEKETDDAGPDDKPENEAKKDDAGPDDKPENEAVEGDGDSADAPKED